MKRWWGATLAVAACVASTSVMADDCAERWGVHRNLEVSTSTGPIGVISYKNTLPLGPREVVLTFDDGPMPRRTPAVLDALKSECAKATFFVIGKMAAAHPNILRRVADEGHTVASHTWSHAYLNVVRSDQRRRDQINGGLMAASAALGDGDPALSPFFRYPGLGRTRRLDRYLERQNLIAMSADVVGDDWRKITPDQVLARVMSRLEARGSGVILLHDIQPRTVAMLPDLLRRLREGGWKLVHIRPRPEETRMALNAVERPRDRRMIAAIEILVMKTTASAPRPDGGLRLMAANKATPGFETLGLRR